MLNDFQQHRQWIGKSSSLTLIIQQLTQLSFLTLV